MIKHTLLLKLAALLPHSWYRHVVSWPMPELEALLVYAISRREQKKEDFHWWQDSFRGMIIDEAVYSPQESFYKLAYKEQFGKDSQIITYPPLEPDPKWAYYEKLMSRKPYDPNKTAFTAGIFTPYTKSKWPHARSVEDLSDKHSI